MATLQRRDSHREATYSSSTGIAPCDTSAPEMPEWYETFFNETALDVWQDSWSDRQTRREVDYLVRSLGLEGRSGRVLDLACGNGRHAVVLAERGHSVTGVDVTAANRERAMSMARDRGVALEFVVADMRHFEPDDEVDAGYCWGNSLGYFSRSGTRELFGRLARALGPGARFVVDTATVAESILTDLSPRTWSQTTPDTRVMLECSYEPRESRLDTVYTTVVNDRVVDTSTAHHWIFTSGELVDMADAAGLQTVALHGDLDGADYSLGDERLLLVLEKRAAGSV